MIICNMEKPGIPLAPPLPPALFGKPKTASVHSKGSSTNSRGGFRLVEDQGDTSSIYSVYKQKIDSMFESDSSTTINTKNNSVQAKIERMFSDVANDGVPVAFKAAIVHTFSVDYLGSVPLHEKVTSLAGLQEPLRGLYLAYKKTTTAKHTLTGRLEISGQGLKVQYQGDKGDLEQLNPFPTIAVWSAVKFVIQEQSTACAFLPLITDPDNIDKKTLFRSLDDADAKYITSEAHSPLFAVVMRKIGLHKQLECHGFVCQTSEDAIVIAATLYKSLMAHMKAKERKPKSRNGITTCMSVTSSAFNDKLSNATPVRPPRKKRSTTSSVLSDPDTGLNTSETQPLISQPHSKKQPKKSTKMRRAPKVPDDVDAIVPYEEPIRLNPTKEEQPSSQPTEIKPKSFSDQINTFMSREQKQITAEIKQVMSESSNKGLKPISVRSKAEEKEVASSSLRKKDNSGDILTKVTIPRSGSFLNAGGLTRYKSKVSRSNGQATGGSPLGFNELFNEFRLQEGLHSMDEILGVIIDPEGMSFNDLKPIYKEFLLKLSVTLTKDELYQRSKSIMRRQRKKQQRNGFHQQNKPLSGPHILVGNKIRRLKHIFQKKLRLGGCVKKKTQVEVENNAPDVPSNTEKLLAESSISTSSYDTRQFTPKEEPHFKKQNSRKTSNGGKAAMRLDRTSTSEESDFFSVRRKARTAAGHMFQHQQQQHHHQNRNSSSGYVSCSECSYDSDTCTCVSADKCYCSLGNKNPGRQRDPKQRCFCHVGIDGTMTYCGCDTDSCTESNKCYCPINTANKNQTILEQLKRRGLIPPSEHLPHMHSQTKHKKLCKNYSNTKSTRSLEYMHNPVEAYYEKLASVKARSMQGSASSRKSRRQQTNCKATDSLALDYELFSIQNVRNGTAAALYAAAMGDPSRLTAMHKQASMRSYSSSRYGSQDGRTLRSTSISAGTCTEALAVKKSAEIAAVFADLNMRQTTDIAHLKPRHHQTNNNNNSNTNNNNNVCDLDAIISSRNAYNRLVTQSAYGPLRHTRDINAISSGQKMVHNALYNSTNNGNGPGVKSNMYSAKNGLYTIQSQSDESRRSSLSEGKRTDRDYFELKTTPAHFHQKNSNSLENSLGYLP